MSRVFFTAPHPLKTGETPTPSLHLQRAGKVLEIRGRALSAKQIEILSESGVCDSTRKRGPDFTLDPLFCRITLPLQR